MLKAVLKRRVLRWDLKVCRSEQSGMCLTVAAIDWLKVAVRGAGGSLLVSLVEK